MPFVPVQSSERKKAFESLVSYDAQESIATRMRIVRTALTVAPPALILWWGGTYVLDAGKLLLAPGVPLGFDYRSPDGVVKLRVEGYAIDPHRWTVAAREFTARRPGGPLLGSVERVDVKGLYPFDLKPVAGIRGVRARVERDSRGLDLARLLPKREGPPSKIPFSVTVRDVRVTYVDKTFSKPITQEVSTDRIVADGMGDDRRYGGVVNLPGVGKAAFRAQQLPNVGITVDVNADRLRLEKLIPILMPGAEAKSLVAYGPLRIDLPDKKDAKVAATLHAEGEGFRYKEYSLDHLVFDGKVSQGGGEGTVEARIADIRARFEGSGTRDGGGGQVVATVPSPRSLPSWVRKYLPARTDFRDARYDGWVGWHGTEGQIDGLAQAARASYGPDSVESIRTRLAYGPTGVAVRGLTALWQGTPIAGDVTYLPKTGAISGAVLAPKVQLAALSNRFGGPKDLSGVIGGTALLSGTTDKPNVEGSVAGKVALQGRSLGNIEARGAWLGGAARVDRVKVNGPLGAIVAGGTVRPDGTLSLKAEARGIRVERLMPEAKGLVSANLMLGGTLTNPKATGRLEAYRLAYSEETLSAAGVDIAADKRSIQLTGLSAVRGTARLRGRMQASLVGKGVKLFDPKSWPLTGRFGVSGIQANEIPGMDAVGDIAGLLTVSGAELSGRVGAPVVIAGIEGDGLIVRGVRMESLRADAHVDRHGATLSNLEANAAGGRVTGSGSFGFADKSGDVDLEVANLQLSRLLTDVSQDVQVVGSVSAPKVHLALANGKLLGSADGTLTGVKVNGELAGDGSWSLNAAGNEVKAEASVGRLEPTLLRAVDFLATYKINEGTLDGVVQAKDLPIKALLAAAASGRSLSENEGDRLNRVSGDFSGTVAFSLSKAGELAVDATDLQASALKYNDSAIKDNDEYNYGTLTAGSVTRRGNRWTVTNTEIKGPAGNYSLSGWFEETGAIQANATGKDVRLTAFAPFVPELGQVAGLGRFDITATGMMGKPVFDGTAGVDGLFAGGSKETMAVSVDKLHVEDGKSEFGGILRYGDRFGGLFTASADWAFENDISDAPLSAKVELGTLTSIDSSDSKKGYRIDPVSLTDIPGLNAYLDPSRGGGTLQGSFTAGGNYKHPKLTGGMNLVAETLGIVVPGNPDRPFKRLDDTLHDVKLGLNFAENNVPVVTASARFERGGTVAMQANIAKTGGDAWETFLSTRDWKALPVDGTVEVKKATARQSIAGANTTASVDGKATINGTAVAPKVTGYFEVSNVEMNLPSLDASTGDSSTSLFDPSFDLTFALLEAGRFRTATADLYLIGDLALKGPLSNPVGVAEFVTDRGSIRLPGGVVRIDKGGQISFVYKRPLAGGAQASADIDLQGRSQVTLTRPGQGTQRYDVTLDMRGDLLRENGLKFDATSDPSDLSKDEILNALGRTDLLSSISAGGSSTERNVRNAFVGFALPGLLDNFTGGVAHGLGLDYLNLEYNEFDQATVAFGSALGPDFSFQGRKQIGTPTPGYRSVYDLRLSYSARRILPKLNRFSFTVGTDQDRPWKTSIEYGTRFGGGGKGKVQPKHVLFPAVKRP